MLLKPDTLWLLYWIHSSKKTKKDLTSRKRERERRSDKRTFWSTVSLHSIFLSSLLLLLLLLFVFFVVSGFSGTWAHRHLEHCYPLSPGWIYVMMNEFKQTKWRWRRLLRRRRRWWWWWKQGFIWCFVRGVFVSLNIVVFVRIRLTMFKLTQSESKRWRK